MRRRSRTHVPAAVHRIDVPGSSPLNANRAPTLRRWGAPEEQLRAPVVKISSSLDGVRDFLAESIHGVSATGGLVQCPQRLSNL